MKAILVTLFLSLVSINAGATYCNATVYAESAHGRGPTLLTSGFGTGSGDQKIGNYLFNLDWAVHGAWQMLTINSILPIQEIFREENNFFGNVPDPVWKTKVSVTDGWISISCQ